jgi:hypothetical protein
LNGGTKILGLSLILLSKVVYTAESGKTKTVTTTLTSQAFTDIDSSVGESEWTDFLSIPPGLQPSHGGIISRHYLLLVCGTYLYVHMYLSL